MLSADDRAFFALVSEAAFANPFGDTRARLDARIAAGSPDRRRPSDLDRTLASVTRRLAKLPRAVSNGADLARYDAEERATIEHAILFDVFHRNAGRFDALLETQPAPSERGPRVSFAPDVIATLVASGFAPAEACRYFALFFQLRRAFVFIGASLPGGSASMRTFRERLWNNLFTHDVRLYARSLWRSMEDFSTFLLGETGTGKGTAAAAIGRAAFIPFDEKTQSFATSFERGFVSINLSQYPEALLESELFGHARGAFTGASSDHAGLFSRGSPHGAVFLDEIGEASIPVQIKLLRVLQDRTFSPVGSRDVLRFSGRVVAATNRPVDELRAAGRLRDDFYYRLSSDVIVVPTLRERLAEAPGELEGLLRVILRRIVGDGSEDLVARVFETTLRDVGKDYEWPGNVRELEQCVRRILLTGHYARDGVGTERRFGKGDADLLAAVGNETAKGLVGRFCRALYERHGSYEEVARRTGLDRRTVKAHVMGETLSVGAALVSRNGCDHEELRRS